MSKLGDRQRKFTLMIGKLIIHAYELGYELSFGRGAVSEAANTADGGHKNSTHLYKLGQDFNIFKDGVYLQDGTGHDELHDFFDELGGAERIEDDLNHYSLEWRGIR